MAQTCSPLCTQRMFSAFRRPWALWGCWPRSRNLSLGCQPPSPAQPQYNFLNCALDSVTDRRGLSSKEHYQAMKLEWGSHQKLVGVLVGVVVMAFMNDNGQRPQLCWGHPLIPSSQQAVPQPAWHVAYPVPPATAIMPHGPVTDHFLLSCCTREMKQEGEEQQPKDTSLQRRILT